MNTVEQSTVDQGWNSTSSTIIDFATYPHTLTPPVVQDHTFYVHEDNATTVSFADIPYSDSDSDSPLFMTFSGALQYGQLYHNSNQITSGASVWVNSSTEFIYVPNGNNTETDVINFYVYDDGYEGSTTKQLSFEPVNTPDYPYSANITQTINEDVPLTITSSMFSFSDDDLGDTFNAIKIESNPDHGVLTLDGSTNVEEVIWNAVPAPVLVYAPESNNSNDTSFHFRVYDGSQYSPKYTFTIAITPENDPPTAQDGTFTFDEDTPLTLQTGDFGFNDVDGDDFEQKIRIDGLPSLGSVSINGSAVNLNDVMTVSNSVNLVYTPDPNQDVNGDFVFSVNDGTEFSTTSNTLTFNLTPLSDPPTSANNTILLNEDTSHTFDATDFPFSSIEINASLDSIRIASLPTGSLSLNGSPVNIGDSVDVSQMANLVFAPDTNDDSSTSFEFYVSDGTKESASSYTMTIDLQPDNDPPTSRRFSLTVNEDGSPFTLSASHFAFSDAESSAIAWIKITALATRGNLRLDGATFGVDEEIPVADLNANKLTFHYGANANGVDFSEFYFKVGDGEDFSTSAYKASITVTPVNDPPVLSGATAAAASTGVLFSQTYSATDQDLSDTNASETLTYSLSNAPTWLAIDDSTGELSGTPSVGDIGSTNVEVVVTDNEGATDSITLALTVNQSNVLPDIDVSAISTRVIKNISADLWIAELGLHDDDDTNFVAATVEILNNVNPVIDLGVSSLGNLSGVEDPTTRKISFSGDFPVAEYEATMRSVRFVMMGNDDNVTRDVEITVDDAEGTQTVTHTITYVSAFENLQDWAAGVSEAIEPTLAHYAEMGLSRVYEDKVSALNSYLIGKSFADLVALQALIDTDADNDKRYAYFDDDDDHFDIEAKYLFATHSAGLYVTAEGDLKAQHHLIRVNFTADSDGQAYQIDVPIVYDANEHNKYWRWPRIVAERIAQENISGVNVGEEDENNPGVFVIHTSGHRNDLVGASNISISLLTAWADFQDYLDDTSLTPPSYTDFQSMGVNSITEANSTDVLAYLVTQHDSGVNVRRVDEVNNSLNNFDEDFDNDGVPFSLDANDEINYTDYDNDGIPDIVETMLGLDPISTDDAALLTQDLDGNFEVDLWEEVKDNLEARVAFNLMHWTAQNQTPGIARYLAAVLPRVPSGDNVHIDLSAISGDATYEFLVHIEQDAHSVQLLTPRVTPMVVILFCTKHLITRTCLASKDTVNLTVPSPASHRPMGKPLS